MDETEIQPYIEVYQGLPSQESKTDFLNSVFEKGGDYRGDILNHVAVVENDDHLLSQLSNLIWRASAEPPGALDHKGLHALLAVSAAESPDPGSDSVDGSAGSSADVPLNSGGGSRSQLQASSLVDPHPSEEDGSTIRALIETDDSTLMVQKSESGIPALMSADVFADLALSSPVARRAALTARRTARLPEGWGWSTEVLDRLRREKDHGVILAGLKVLGRCDVLGVTYLDFGLERYGSEIPGPVLSHLAMAMDNPQDWLEVFGGLLDPRHRALGRAVNGLSALKPGPFEKLLKSLIFSSDPLYQRLGFACLLEAEDEMAFPILAEFPEELAQGTAEDSYRDMRSTFDLRRYFKRASLGYYPIRCLGRGGMGEVYLSTDIKRSHRISALKFLKVPEAGIDPDIIERFKREARVPLLLKHPGVVRVFDYGNQDNLYWIDTDYIHGLTLQEKLQKTGPIALHEAIGIVKQIGSALEYLQRKSIVHRDLKPANVFLGHDPPIAMLGDFGLVQINDEAIQKEVPNYVPTQAQLILGTVGYMSPEQAIAEGTDHSTDLFSLGVIFYEMIAGRLPFRTGSLAEYHRSLFNEEPQPYGQSMTGVVWTVIRKLIQKDPRNRYSGAAELLEALAELEHALHAGGGSLAGDSHTVSLNLQESENLDDGATIVAPVLETPGVAVTGVDGSPAALGPSAHPTSPAGLTPGTLGGVIPTQPAGTAIETPGTIPLPPQVDTASYPPNQALHPGFMPQGPQAGIYPPGYPAPQSAAYPVPGYPTGIQAYPGMPPTGIYPAPGVPGGFYPIQPEMTGPMTTAGGVPGSGPQSVKCLPDPLKCNRCCASLPREGMYCRHCKFDDMPLIPWLVSWGLVVAAFLCVLPVTLQIELPVPYFVANPMLLPFLGVFLFLIGRAMRDSHWLAFVLASIPLFVLPILSLTAFGLLRSTPIGRWPDWLVVNFIQMAGLEGSNVPQELALRWVTSDGLLPYAYASLGLLITGFLMTSRASVDHFGVSRRFRFALIFLSLLVLAVIVRLFT